MRYVVSGQNGIVTSCMKRKNVFAKKEYIMDKKNPNNHNPEGHNQYTKNDKKSGSSSKSQQTSGQSGSHSQKAPAHNPEGHNQYTK